MYMYMYTCTWMKYCVLKYFNRVYIHANIKIVICACTLYMYSQETTMYTMYEQYCIYPNIFTCTCTIYMYMSICDQECNKVFSKPKQFSMYMYVKVSYSRVVVGGGGGGGSGISPPHATIPQLQAFWGSISHQKQSQRV